MEKSGTYKRSSRNTLEPPCSWCCVRSRTKSKKSSPYSLAVEPPDVRLQVRERAVTALAWLPAKFCYGNLATSLPLSIPAQSETASDCFPLAQLSQQTNSSVRSRRALPVLHDHSAIMCSALLLLPSPHSLPSSLLPSLPFSLPFDTASVSNHKSLS